MKWKSHYSPLVSFREIYLTRLKEEGIKEAPLNVRFNEPVNYHKIEKEINAWLNNLPVKNVYPIYYFSGKEITKKTREKRMLYLYSAIFHLKQDAEAVIKITKQVKLRPTVLTSSIKWERMLFITCLCIMFFISYLFYRKNHKVKSYLFFIILFSLLMCSYYC